MGAAARHPATVTVTGNPAARARAALAQDHFAFGLRGDSAGMAVSRFSAGG